jgi:hypothetical protein
MMKLNGRRPLLKGYTTSGVGRIVKMKIFIWLCKPRQGGFEGKTFWPCGF